MDEQSNAELRRILDELVNAVRSKERCIQGRVGLDDDNNVILEAHIDDHCIALMADILDDDTYSITFAGGYRNGERFALDNKVLVIADEVDALMKLPEAIIEAVPELARDKEGIKACIHDQWIDPATARLQIEALILMSSLEEDYDG